MTKKQSRGRNPIQTRKKIIEASMALLAREGSDALSVSGVAKLANVNRSTAYEYFRDRDALIEATLTAVASDLEQALFTRIPIGEAEAGFKQYGKKVLDEIAIYFVENPNICGIWLDQLTRQAGRRDILLESLTRACDVFSKSSLGHDDVDAEVQSLSMLSALLVWPLWINAQSLSPKERKKMALRLSNEQFRHGLFGSMRANKLPGLVEELRESQKAF